MNNPNLILILMGDSILRVILRIHDIKLLSGLLRLVFHQPDEEILDAIETLADDPVPSVRMVTAMEFTNLYAKLCQKGSGISWTIWQRNERNGIVQGYVSTLHWTRVVAHRKENEDKTTRIMAKLFQAHTGTSRETKAFQIHLLIC